MIQLVQPNPSIPCKPGWCLKYVRETFGAKAVEPSATAGWANADFKHRDKNFPNAWVPLWFSLDTTPLGHVVLRSPRGIIYSTSSLANTPYVHPNLDHLMAYYAKYKMNLTYLGWSEDISNVRVVKPEEVEEDMPTAREIVDELLDRGIARQGEGVSGVTNLGAMIAWNDANLAKIPLNVWSYRNPSGEEPRDAYQILRDIPQTPQAVADEIPDNIAQEVIDALSRRLAE